MSRFIKLLIITALSASLNLVAYPANASANSHTSLNTCGYYEFKPKRIFLACGDGGEGVHSIKWFSWTSDTATGKGTYYINNCTPSCADGKYLERPVQLLASRSRMVHGKYQFTRFVVRATKGKLPYVGTTEIQLKLPRG